MELPVEHLLAHNEALTNLAEHDAQAAQPTRPGVTRRSAG
jgi:hypothetical protein